MNKVHREVYEFYENGAEVGRLERGVQKAAFLIPLAIFGVLMI